MTTATGALPDLADLLREPKIDCHVHVLDPARFPYDPATHYAPSGQEIGTAAQLDAVMATYGTRHALLVGPNSGYGLDNRCMLDAIARAPTRFRGIAVVRNDTSLDELARLKDAGVVGVAWNVTHYGVDHYHDAAPLLRHLAALDMFVDIQTEHDQLVRMMPLLDGAPGVRILVDHCGRPTLAAGLDDPDFRALQALGRTGRAFVKLSGFVKFSQQAAPYEDTWPHARALVESFGLDRCLWASDWPYLRAPRRVDYGVLLAMLPRLFPRAEDRRRLLWDTPRAALGFAQA
jgi:predicted TIM-barrel fold metal-dependent hydrolase